MLDSKVILKNMTSPDSLITEMSRDEWVKKTVDSSIKDFFSHGEDFASILADNEVNSVIFADFFCKSRY